MSAAPALRDLRSGATAPAPPRPRTAPGGPGARSAPGPAGRGHLRLVPDIAGRPHGPVVVVTTSAGLLALTLFGLLTLNVAISGNAFHLDQLREEAGELADHQQELDLRLAERASPQQLDARARGMGMAPPPSPPAVLDLDAAPGGPEPAP